jgi:hypothetical protein
MCIQLMDRAGRIGHLGHDYVDDILGDITLACLELIDDTRLWSMLMMLLVAGATTLYQARIVMVLTLDAQT